MDIVDKLKEKFLEVYGYNREEIFWFYSPEVIRLLGQKINHKGAKILCIPVSTGIYSVVRYRRDDNIEIKIINNKGVNFDDISDYISTRLKSIIKEYNIDGGVEILFYSELPVYADFYSSPNVEILLNKIIQYDNIRNELRRIKSEDISIKELLKSKSSIIDTYAISMCRERSAMLLDCTSLECKYFKLQLDNSSIVLITLDNLEGSVDYANNEHFECQKAYEAIKEFKKINCLFDATIVDTYYYIRDPILQKKALHMITENLRLEKAVKVLNDENYEYLGNLMLQSNQSQKDYYIKDNIYLDVIVEESLRTDGCLGCKITSLSSFDCVVALVENKKIKEFQDKVSSSYARRVNKSIGFCVSNLDYCIKTG